MRQLKPPRLESLFIATFALLGFRLGVQPISDNSMLTHIRTGIDMAGGLGIPRTDQYSFTAAGKEWVVQSWLPEWTYGWAERLGGFELVVLEQAVLLALLAYLVVRLARAASPLRTALSGGIVVAIGAPFWSHRPLLFGLICMALLVLAMERRLTPWVLVPIVWVWVNSHGSFPLGLVWLGARAAGEYLDWRTWPRETARYIWGFLGCLLIAVVNPLGLRLLLFPLTIGEKRSIFENVVEWRSPDFQVGASRFALIFIVIALVLLLRARLTWRDAVPSVVFLALGLIALRNLPVFAIVIAPVLARVLHRPDAAGPLRAPSESQLRINRVMAVALGAMFVLFAGSVFASEPLRLNAYPERAVTYLEDNGLLDEPHRLAHQDVVGNYLNFRYGRDVKVFIDDRIDMYPLSVSEDYVRLLRGRTGWRAILDEYRIDTVLWQRNLPLAQILAEREDWREVYRRGEWVVYRRGA